MLDFNQKRKEDSYNELLKILQHKVDVLTRDQNDIRNSFEEMAIDLAKLNNKIVDHLEYHHDSDSEDPEYYHGCNCCDEFDDCGCDCDCHDFEEDEGLYRRDLCCDEDGDEGDEPFVIYPGVVIDAELDIDGEPYLPDADYELIKTIVNGKEKVDIIIITENTYQFIIENLREDVIPRMVYATKSFHVVPNIKCATLLIESLQNTLDNLD